MAKLNMVRVPRWARCALFAFAIVVCPLTAFGVSYSPQPDCDGAISEIAIHYDPEMHDELLPLYHDLFKALDRDVTITLVSPSAEATEQFTLSFGEEATQGGRIVRAVEIGMRLTIWARDRLFVLGAPMPSTQFMGFVPLPWPGDDDYRLNELIIGDRFVQAGVIPVANYGRFHLEGGNVVSNGRHVFIGSNIFGENEGIVSEEQVRVMVNEFANKDVVYLQDVTGNVPWVHCDMYLTPLDSTTIALGSLDLGLELSDIPCEGYGLEDAEDESSYAPESPLASTMQSCWDESIQYQLDEVADQVRQLGYRVVRTPILADPGRSWMVTYNNVLLEHRDGMRIVYMPTYAIPELDEAAARIYEELGYVVKTVDVSRIYEFGGALRCTTNVIKRRPDRMLMRSVNRPRDGVHAKPQPAS